MNLRPLTEADLPSIAALQHDSPSAAQWAPGDYLTYQTLVAEDGQAILGFIVWRQVAQDEMEILNLVVHPSARRRGIARTLLSQATKSFVGNVYLEVRETNQPALSFYTSAGFLVVGTRKQYYHSSPESGIVMYLQKC